MILKNDWLWDRKITVDKARAMLKDPKNSHFLSISATLLARKNTPKEVFRYYLKPLDFVQNWQRIKRQMRKDEWNNPRIEYWQAIYEMLKEKYKKRGISLKKEAIATGKQDIFCKTIANKIKSARKEKGLTQSELANKLRVSQQIISRIEAGRENVSLVTLKKLADAMDVELKVDIVRKR